MKRRTLDPAYLEDLDNYLVEVTAKRPYFHKEMMSLVLRCQQRFEEGDVLALHDALVYCERGGLPLPPWLSQAMRERLIDSFSGGMTGSRGRGNSPLGTAKKRLKQMVHYRLVKKCQSIRLKLEGERLVAHILTRDRAETLDTLRHVFPPALWEKIEDPSNALKLDDFGDSLESNYLAVSKILRGTFAQAEPRTIMKSCKAVEEKMGDSNATSNIIEWFEEADPETLEALGLQLEMSEAEMSAWKMGAEFIEPEADRSASLTHFLKQDGTIDKDAKKS